MEAAGRRIVVGIDGSDASRTALLWALGEAARREASLEVVTAFPVDVYWLDPFLVDSGRIDAVRASTESLAQEMVEDARRDPSVAATPAVARVDVHVLVVAGAPAPKLVQRSDGADLLVVGSQGRSAVRSALGGSVALHCAAHARCPVVVVHPGAGAEDESARVVVGLDDSVHARAALAAALAHAGRLGARVDAVIAYEGPRYWSELYADLVASPDELRQRALEHGRRIVAEVIGRGPTDGDAVSVRAVEGPPSSVLVREAAGARLLVVGSRSRNPLEGLVLGSVALTCVTSAPCPVLVVRLRPDGTPYASARTASTAASLAG